MTEYSVNELYHHGILGQKWGVRRYQNKDGSLTPAGQKRVNRMKEEYTNLTGKQLRKSPAKKVEVKKSSEKKNVQKKISEMSDQELRDRIARLELEKNVLNLEKQVSAYNPKKDPKIKAFMKSSINDVAIPALKDAGKKALTNYFQAKLQDILGVEIKKDIGPKLKEAVNDAKDDDDNLAFNKLKDKISSIKENRRNKKPKKTEEAEDDNNNDKNPDNNNNDKNPDNNNNNRGSGNSNSSNNNNNDKGSNNNDSGRNKSNENKHRESKKAEEYERFNATADDIIGEGRNSYKDNKKSYKDNKKYDDIIDAEWRDVTKNEIVVSSNVSSGHNYVSGFLEQKISALPKKY